MINIQNEVQKIHNQYGISEIANYKIQLLCEQYAKEYHDSEVKKLNIPAVTKSVCGKCQSYLTNRYCNNCVKFKNYQEKY